MMLRSEIAFYLLRFYLYTKINNFVRRSSFKAKIRDGHLKTTFMSFPKFREFTLESKQEFKDFLEVNEELKKRTKVIKNWDMKENVITSPLSLENSNVQRVIEISKDILNQNMVLTVEKLLNISKKVLGIPQSALLSIIQFLVKNHVVIDGSKFSRKSVLDNNLRKNILEYIHLNGCAHFSFLRKEVVLEQEGYSGSSGQLIWHLDLLMQFNYIKKIKVGNYTVFIPVEMEIDIGIINFLLQDEISRRIVELLTIQDSLMKKDFLKKIDENRGKINYRINNLINYDIICYKNNHNNEVCVNPNILEKVINVLNKFKSKSLKDKLNL